MNTPDKEIEKIIKEKLSSLKPSRSVFDEIMKNVTTKEDIRYTGGKDDMILSPYQTTSQIFMKKLIMIGTPVFALILVAVISTKTTTWPTSAMPETKTTDNNISANIDSNDVNTQKDTTNLNVNETIDDVFASIMSDIEADNVSITLEEEDTNTINTELQNYNNVKNTNYDDII